MTVVETEEVIRYYRTGHRYILDIPLPRAIENWNKLALDEQDEIHTIAMKAGKGLI